MKPQMHTDTHGSEIDDLTEQIIGCAFRVQNNLGCGFLEKVYENALTHELRASDVRVDQQVPIKVRYDGVIVGDYVADLIVENTVLIEIKATKGIDNVHLAQCINYLKATGLEICLLLNFGTPKIQIKRFRN